MIAILGGDRFNRDVARSRRETINFIVRILLFLLCAQLAWLPFSGAAAESQPVADSPASTNSPGHWVPGTRDQLIAVTTADMLTNSHYLHLPLDATVSDKFLTMYLNTLDPQHLHFLQSDLAEFEHYRKTLGEMTVRGDTAPAYLIFNRFMERLEARTAFLDEILKAGPLMDFTAAEEMPLSRKNAPYPKDMDDARRLWLQRLRYEYLQERLGGESNPEFARELLNSRNPIAMSLMWHDVDTNIVDLLNRRNSRNLRTFRDWESDKVLETYLTSLGHVYDPHTDYYDQADLENFSIQMSGTLFGIGATLSLSDDGYTTIEALVPSGPAAKSKKLKVKDRIVKVAQGDDEPVDVKDMPLVHVVDKIRGPKGTEVRLTVIPADAVDPSTTVVIPIVRDEINLEEQQAKAELVELPGDDGKPVRLGVIDLPEFYASFLSVGSANRPETFKSTTVDVAHLLDKLKRENVSGVILDLRRNGGGSLEEAINLTGLFVGDGPVVQVRSSDGTTDIKRDHDGNRLYDGPLIVLTDRLSASASEIVAGALQDYGRAVIVGDPTTHGKGSVQSMSQLAPYLYYRTHRLVDDPQVLGALKYTTNKFYRINGSSTQLRGVDSDIVLPSTYTYMDMLGETNLDNALPWDTIKPTRYDALNCVQPFLPELKKRSAVRVASSKDFDYVREDIEQVKKVSGDKTISLNERQRLKDVENDEARALQRADEIKARKWPDEKVYEINLKIADQPGLPPPLLISNGVVVTNQVSMAATPNSDTPASPDAGAGADSPAPKLPPAPADYSPEERAPLVEAEHILLDYIAVWNPETAFVKTHEPLASGTPSGGTVDNVPH